MWYELIHCFWVSHSKSPENQLSAQDGVTLQNTQAWECVYVWLVAGCFISALFWCCLGLSAYITAKKQGLSFLSTTVFVLTQISIQYCNKPGVWVLLQNDQDSVTCCAQKQLPAGHGGSTEGFGCRLLLLEEDGGQGCFETTHDCNKDRFRAFSEKAINKRVCNCILGC